MQFLLRIIEALSLDYNTPVSFAGVEVAMIAAVVLSAAATAASAVMNKPPKPPTPKAPAPVAAPTKAPEAAPVKESETVATDQQKRARKAFQRSRETASGTLMTGGLGSSGGMGSVAKTLLGGGK